MYYYYPRAGRWFRCKENHPSPEGLLYCYVLYTSIDNYYILQKTFQCNGSVNVDPDNEKLMIAQLSGDQRNNVYQFLVDQEICHADQIVIHGGG